MHDKTQFGDHALENMVKLSGKSQEYLTRATQRYYRKTPMQMINEIRINFAKKQLEMTTTPLQILPTRRAIVVQVCLLKPLKS